MIALDSSALVSIAIREAGFEAFREAVASYPCVVGAPTLHETYAVLRGKPETDPALFVDALIRLPNLSVAAFTREHFAVSRWAFDRYGKGRGAGSGLNFGDCLSYAIAKVANVPLLFKGRDFVATDLASALEQ